MTQTHGCLKVVDIYKSVKLSDTAMADMFVIVCSGPWAGEVRWQHLPQSWRPHSWAEGGGMWWLVEHVNVVIWYLFLSYLVNFLFVFGRGLGYISLTYSKNLTLIFRTFIPPIPKYNQQVKQVIWNVTTKKNFFCWLCLV